jgi:hypothetical protein
MLWLFVVVFGAALIAAYFKGRSEFVPRGRKHDRD